MFPLRYFCAELFAPRYFPKPGAISPEPPPEPEPPSPTPDPSQFRGKHPDNQTGPDPTVSRGPGIVSGPSPVFIGGHPIGDEPTLLGYIKKRPALGDTTVLDQL
jgi:hypothetical protein